MYKHILLPIDGSKISEEAAVAGIHLARALSARVTTLHVLPLAPGGALEAWIHDDPEFETKLARSLEKRGEMYLENIRDIARRAGVPCECALARGPSPHGGIIAAAREHDCDLIVMASHGRMDAEGVLLGSETAKTATLSDIPVLVHRVRRP